MLQPQACTQHFRFRFSRRARSFPGRTSVRTLPGAIKPVSGIASKERASIPLSCFGMWENTVLCTWPFALCSLDLGLIGNLFAWHLSKVSFAPWTFCLSTGDYASGGLGIFLAVQHFGLHACWHLLTFIHLYSILSQWCLRDTLERFVVGRGRPCSRQCGTCNHSSVSQCCA